MNLPSILGIVLTLPAAFLSGHALAANPKRVRNRIPAIPTGAAVLSLIAGYPVPSFFLSIAALVWALLIIRSGSPDMARYKQLYDDEKKKRAEIEERYRKIFEGSENIILLLDTELRIREANLSVKKHLDRSHASIVNTNLRDLISINDTIRGSTDISSLAIEERLTLFLKQKRSVELTFPIQGKTGPMNVRCSLTFISQQKNATIMATLTPMDVDHLTGFLLREEQQHAIDNQIITVDEICKRITRNLLRYTTHTVKNQILLGLREIVLNAMEHGNLEIDYDMKTNALENRQYMDLLKARQGDPRYNKRKIKIRYILEPDRVRYVITDEGKGFNHAYFAKKKHYQNKELLLHGRGIMMSKNIFDDVRYTKKGTEVTLTKWF